MRLRAWKQAYFSPSACTERPTRSPDAPSATHTGRLRGAWGVTRACGWTRQGRTAYRRAPCHGPTQSMRLRSLPKPPQRDPKLGYASE